VTRPGRFLCHVHRYVITSSMAGCPKCLTDQTEQEQLL